MKIGPTFGDELRAAGAQVDGVCWNSETGAISFEPEVDEAARAQVLAVFGRHDVIASSRTDAMLRLRLERNRRLDETDWSQLADVPKETQAAWTSYRQSLRDLPAAVDLSPIATVDALAAFEPTWPSKPA